MFEEDRRSGTEKVFQEYSPSGGVGLAADFATAALPGVPFIIIPMPPMPKPGMKPPMPMPMPLIPPMLPIEFIISLFGSLGIACWQLCMCVRLNKNHSMSSKESEQVDGSNASLLPATKIVFCIILRFWRLFWGNAEQKPLRPNQKLAVCFHHSRSQPWNFTASSEQISLLSTGPVVGRHCPLLGTCT